jgi:hypothetical protein
MVFNDRKGHRQTLCDKQVHFRCRK